MPAVAIETVIIIIVVVSFSVLAAVIFALYWLWRLLLEDRRCSRLRCHPFHHEWQRQSLGPLVEGGPQQTQLLSRTRQPRVARREVFVDERSRRMVKSQSSHRQKSQASRCCDNPEPPPRPEALRDANTRTPDVVVLDGTEPPPPYDEIT